MGQQFRKMKRRKRKKLGKGWSIGKGIDFDKIKKKIYKKKRLGNRKLEIGKIWLKGNK